MIITNYAIFWALWRVHILVLWVMWTDVNAEVSYKWKILNNGADSIFRGAIMRNYGEYFMIKAKLGHALHNLFLGFTVSSRISLQIFYFKFDVTNNYKVNLLIGPIFSTNLPPLLKAKILGLSKFRPVAILHWYLCKNVEGKPSISIISCLPSRKYLKFFINEIAKLLLGI